MRMDRSGSLQIWPAGVDELRTRFQATDAGYLVHWINGGIVHDLRLSSIMSRL
jgi:hypothetical protein